MRQKRVCHVRQQSTRRRTGSDEFLCVESLLPRLRRAAVRLTALHDVAGGLATHIITAA